MIGTPQGLAVYQNGVRINEVFGDIVNWDFIPQNAINQLTLVPSNPVYGLNATGGALAFEMKNGYTYHAAEGELSGGSYGRAVASVQAGGKSETYPAISRPTRSTTPAGVLTPRHHYGASTLILVLAGTRPNFTSRSPAPTISSTARPPRQCRCSARTGQASTLIRKRRIISSRF